MLCKLPTATVFQATRNNVLHYKATLQNTYTLKKNLKSSATVSGSQTFLNQEAVQEMWLL
jgi:hypothetical protein